MGTRVIREYSFNEQGEFVVEQSAEKVNGAPISLSLWTVTQVVQPDAFFLPTNPESPYKNNFHWIAKPQKEVSQSTLSPSLMMVRPTQETNYKIGTDAPITAIALVKDGVAFVQRASKPDGEYPDGALGAGFPVELWNNVSDGLFYNELELLSPLRTYRAGMSFKHTVRWSLHRLPSEDVTSPEVHQAMQTLFGA
jgi:hypothetical protein